MLENRMLVKEVKFKNVKATNVKLKNKFIDIYIQKIKKFVIYA